MPPTTQRTETLQTEWMSWADLPWWSPGHPASRAARLCDRIAHANWGDADWPEAVQRHCAELAEELSVRWVAVLERTPKWETIAEFGRAAESLPWPGLEEALDREEAGLFPATDGGDVVIAAPVHLPLAPCVLVFAGRQIVSDDLPLAVTAARALQSNLHWLQQRRDDLRRTKSLEAILEIGSEFAATRDSETLLQLIAEEATRLLDCDRSSIFIWDRAQQELVARPALGVSGGTLRLGDRDGVVGHVVQTGETVRVDDAYGDSRFDASTDSHSGFTTSNLLCCPLVDAQGERLGAFEVMNKHHGAFDEHDELTLRQLGTQAAIALQNTREREHLLRSQEQLTEQVTAGIEIVGESEAIQALRATIERLAPTDLPVLILGESGTGKEVVSQALHFRGPRAQEPFVAINCAALPESLLESELFGHEPGAFTDAREARAGKFELADGGTLFLDEIGEMSLGGQAKLLRVLEDKVITRVGGSEARPIAVRVIAATNVNLADAVRDKKFRADLYYRLSVVHVTLPPLRERPEDILPLADHFIRQFTVDAGRPALTLSPEAKLRLQGHGWPGNIRELRNLTERVAYLCTGPSIEADDLTFILSPAPESSFELTVDLGLREASDRFQQEYIRRAIRRVSGNMTEAARLLGLHRSNLYRKMRQLGMSEAGGED